MNYHVRFRRWEGTFSLVVLAVAVSFTTPLILLAAAPNVVLNRAIHFPALNGNPITLPPGQYLIEQAGPQELRVTAVVDKQEFLIRAQALTHEQYELFTPMALTRYGKNHELLMNLLLPGGIRLEKPPGVPKHYQNPSLAKDRPHYTGRRIAHSPRGSCSAS
ncbi:MAG: hypothetical protein WD425_21265 [Nitrospirales bacterium]